MAEIANLPIMYITGCTLNVSIGTELQISSGQLRDSTNSYDMVVHSPLTVSNTALGLNGVDTGIVAGKEKDAQILMATELYLGKPCIDYCVTEAEDKLLIYLYSFHISL